MKKFFDRELCSKVLKEALLLLFLLLAGNRGQKMFQMEQKMFANFSLFQIEQNILQKATKKASAVASAVASPPSWANVSLSLLNLAPLSSNKVN